MKYRRLRWPCVVTAAFCLSLLHGPTAGSQTRAKAVSPSRKPVAAKPLAVSPLDSLATTPLPLNDNSNAYWMIREYMNELRAMQNRHAEVVFLGDSITDGFKYGVGAPVWNLLFAPLNAEDFAIGGLTTSQVLWQIRTGQVAALTPRVVVIMIGTNNLGLGQSPTAVASGIMAIVDQLKAQLPNSRILLLGVFPRGQSPSDPYRALIAQVNTMISELEETNRIHYVDIGYAFQKRGGTISPTVMSDFVHPTLYGYQIYAVAIWQPLIQLLRATENLP